MALLLDSQEIQIKLSNRFISEAKQKSLMVVDGIVFRIQEPQKNGFNPKWYSHKYRKPAVRYEFATCFNTGQIVLIYVPFPCGSRDDITLFTVLDRRDFICEERRSGLMVDIEVTQLSFIDFFLA